ncbi:hypothetical protein BT67DRAFT_444165 [Trichocladium antarcticum]|uniref:Extracellular membrane protein CFEM domain-containing protein n=1 Tax=Trichocladium antarcticum TaxID=1450529 RepID=A0AAN6UG27_9PEZI|nr:hypothetical protein BT67DRAFT_444165 [Trichocladium antarcticum]
MALKAARVLGAAILPFFIFLSEAAVPVSFSSYPSYLEQLKCVKVCLWEVGSLDDLIAGIGCSPPWVNECFCNPELARSAAGFLATCVASRCTIATTAPAITSAQSAYNKYCSDNDFSIPALASIKSYSAYLSQPDCVQKCLWDSPEAAGLPDHDGDLMPAVGCHAPLDNACLCNATLAGTASSFLSGCVASRCATTVEAPVTAALSVHRAYCSSAGLPLPAVVETTSTDPLPYTETMSESRLGTPSSTSVYPPVRAADGTPSDRSFAWRHCRNRTWEYWWSFSPTVMKTTRAQLHGPHPVTQAQLSMHLGSGSMGGEFALTGPMKRELLIQGIFVSVPQ